MCLTVDKEAIAQYDAKLKEERKRAEDQVRLVKLVKPFQRLSGHFLFQPGHLRHHQQELAAFLFFYFKAMKMKIIAQKHS
jgi:hypothetical protein